MTPNTSHRTHDTQRFTDKMEIKWVGTGSTSTFTRGNLAVPKTCYETIFEAIYKQ